MKTGLKFGFNAVQAGQKSATLNAVPQLIVRSTAGGFTITAPVSKALGIASGESVQFLNNIDEIEKAIQQNNPDVLAYAQDKGYDLTTADGQQKVIADLTCWAIAKGVALFDQAGNPLMSKVRVSAEEKQAYINEHGAEIIASLSDDEKAAFAEAKGVDVNDTDALVAALTVEDIPSPTAPAVGGSKTSANGSATGIGLQLSFTDTAIWNSLKGDLEDKTSVVRVFNVDIKNPIEGATVHNGKEYVSVLAYPIEFVEDKEPARTGFAKED